MLKNTNKDYVQQIKKKDRRHIMKNLDLEKIGVRGK